MVATPTIVASVDRPVRGATRGGGLAGQEGHPELGERSQNRFIATKRGQVPLGRSLHRLLGDFLVVCRNVGSKRPERFVFRPPEVRKLAHKKQKDGCVSYWLQPKDYAKEAFREAWHRIGSGLA